MRDPILSSSPPPAAPAARRSPFSDSGDELAEPFITQQTIPWAGRSTHLAANPTTTQPTQILSTPHRPRAHAAEVQVARSSPAVERYSSQFSPPRSQMSQPRFNPMAPPGTYTLLPEPVRRPVVDLVSDDPPVEPDSEEESQINSAPKSTSRVEETPEKRFDMSKFSYNPNAQHKRAASPDELEPRAKFPKIAPRQTGPSRAMPVQENDMSLSDIQDFDLKRNVQRLRIINHKRSIREIHEALIKNHGDYATTCDYFNAQEMFSEDSPKAPSHHATPIAPAYQPKKTAQRGLNMPIKSITEKYSTFKNTQGEMNQLSPQQPKKRGRLQRGRRNPSPSPELQAQSSTGSGKNPIAIDDEEDEAIAISSDDSEAEASEEEQVDDAALLNFFNTCSVEAMVDLSSLKEEEIRSIFDHRPFTSLAKVEGIHVNLTETKGKKARKPRVTFGQRLVEASSNMWRGFTAVDSLVQKCEERGRPIVSTMSTWGVDVSVSGTADGELALVSLDDSSDTSSTRDSGLGTPRDSDDELDPIRKRRITTGGRVANVKHTYLKKPAIMSKAIELKDYQVVGLNWLSLLWNNGVSGILADDMGLGKTCQVIAFLSHLKEQKVSGPHLIVVPGSTLENWLREMKRFSPDLAFTPYHGKDRFEHQLNILDNLETIDVIVTTYDMAFRKEDNAFIRKCKPQACIFDEGHMLRNSKTQRYQQLMRIPAKWRLLLTGTPLQNSLQELASILAFIMPDIFREVGEDLDNVFKHKAKVVETDSHSALLSTQRIQRARSMMTPFILRRKKAQVLRHLPTKTTRVEYCTLTETQKKLYSAQMEKQRKVLLDRANGIQTKEHANVMMRLRQAAIHPLLFRDRYDDKVIRKMSRSCLKAEMFAESDPDIIYEELELYQDYQCHQLALKYPEALSKFVLKNDEWLDSGKVSKLAELLTKHKKNGDRTLVFSQFTSVMDILQWVLDTLDISYSRLDGSTPIAERQDLLDQFYEDESISVFMLSTKSGGAGINLACANKVIIFDSSFNPQDDIQAENRAHRVGQTREVEVIRLVTKDTVEEQIHALGVSKLELDKMVSGEEEGGAGAKKGALAASDKMSAAEELGIEAVEKMMMEQLKKGGDEDVKDKFLDGLKAAGLDMSAA